MASSQPIPGELAVAQAAGIAVCAAAVRETSDSPSMRPRLLLSARHASTPFAATQLTVGRYALGSDPQCELHLPVEGVAPRHCLLVVGEDRTILKAWAPQTWVNDGVVTEGLLRSGDRLIVGPVELRVELSAIQHASPDAEFQAQVRELQQASGQHEKLRRLQAREQQLNDLLEDVRVMLDDVLRRQKDVEHTSSRERLVLQHRAAELQAQGADLELRRQAIELREQTASSAATSPDEPAVALVALAYQRELESRAAELAGRAAELAQKNRQLRDIEARKKLADAAEQQARILQARHDAQQRQLERNELSLISQSESLQDQAAELWRQRSQLEEARRRSEGEQKAWDCQRRNRETLLDDLEESLGSRIREVEQEALRLEEWDARLQQERREINAQRFAQDEAEVCERETSLADSEQNRREGAALEQEREALRLLQDELAAAEQSLHAEREDWQSRIEEHENSSTMLRQQEEQLQGATSRLQADYEAFAAEQQSQQLALQDDREQLRNEAAALQIQRDELQTLNLELAAERERLDSQAAQLHAARELSSQEQAVAAPSPEIDPEAEHSLQQVLVMREAEVERLRAELAESQASAGNSSREELLAQREKEFREHEGCLEEREIELRRQLNELDDRADGLTARAAELDEFDHELRKVESHLAARDMRLSDREAALNLRADELQQQSEALEQKLTTQTTTVASPPDHSEERLELAQLRARLDAERMELGLEAARLRELQEKLKRESLHAEDDRLSLAEERGQLDAQRRNLELQSAELDRLRLELESREQLAVQGSQQVEPEVQAAEPEPESSGDADYDAWKNSVLARFGIDAPPAEAHKQPEPHANLHGAREESHTRSTSEQAPATTIGAASPAGLRSELAELFGIQPLPGVPEKPQDDTASSDPSIEVHPPSQDRMDRMLTPVTRPGAIPADAVPLREINFSEDADVETSVASYMEGLLARSRPGGQAAPPIEHRYVPPPPAPVPPKSVAEVAAAEAREESTRKARKLKSEDKQSLRADLDSFRELANHSARSAVAKSQASRKQTNLKMLAGIACLAWVSAVTLLSTELWMAQPQRLAALVASVVAIVLSVLMYLRHSEIRLLSANVPDRVAGEAQAESETTEDEKSGPEGDSSNPLSFL